jgi:YD repeat-containing protein
VRQGELAVKWTDLSGALVLFSNGFPALRKAHLNLISLIATGAVGICVSNVASAAQTVTYSYDALGRLAQVQIAGGPGSGITQNYQYDVAGNRLQQTVSAPGQNSVSLAVSSPIVNVTSTGVTLTVNVSGSAPSGTVTFTENGVFLGMAYVMNGQASIGLEQLPAGAHSIKATYSGDGTYAPTVNTFSISVRDLRWLHAVLELLLSN